MRKDHEEAAQQLRLHLSMKLKVFSSSLSNIWTAPLRTGNTHTHLRDVSEQSPVELVDGVTVQL